jgi:hypothetical protein
MNLERVDVLQAQMVGRSAKISAELRYRVEIGSLRCRRQIADRHVLDHASAERAQLGHRKTSCLKGWALKTLDPQTGGGRCHLSSNAAPAASFNPSLDFARKSASLPTLPHCRQNQSPAFLELSRNFRPFAFLHGRPRIGDALCPALHSARRRAFCARVGTPGRRAWSRSNVRPSSRL